MPIESATLEAMNTDSVPPEPHPDRRRRNQLITAFFLALVVGLFFLLATSVSGVKLLEGEPFALPRMSQSSMSPGSVPGFDILMVIFRIMLALALIALPFYIILSILTKEGRRRLLMNMIIVGLLILAVSWLRSLSSGDDLLQTDGMLLEEPAQGNAPNARPLPDFTANPSDEVVLAATLAISLIIVGMAAAMIWVIARRRQPPPSAMDALAEEAQQAINAIQAGGPLEETITRCYREMCRVLQEERGIERSIAMTPGEFEQVLQGKGMPKQAVHQLTHLFEEIRYGSKPAGPREEQLAVESLTAIAAACSHPQRATA